MQAETKGMGNTVHDGRMRQENNSGQEPGEFSNSHFDFLGWLSGAFGRAREAADQGALA
jgi:hypothetical protein